MFVLCGLGLCALTLMVAINRVEFSSFTAERSKMSLACTFIATLMLSLTTMHPDQPVSPTMDLVSFGYHDGGIPALAQLQFETAARQDALLVPIHSRVPMGMLGLWLSLILCALLFVVPLLRNLANHPVVQVGYYIPPLLSGVVFFSWLQSILGSFSEVSFALYLSEFDLAAIDMIHYPTQPWQIDCPLGLISVVGALLALGLIFLRAPIPESASDPEGIEKVSQFAGLGILCMTILVIASPTSFNHAGEWTAISCLLFAMITLVDRRGVVRVWSSLCCLVVAGMGWTVL